jgi:nitrogen fixation protein NifU and related proteins
MHSRKASRRPRESSRFREPFVTVDDFYRDFILDHYRNPRNFGHLSDPSASAEDLNPLCGDQIRIELAVEDGIVQDVRFSGKGCAISQASASMLTEAIKGMPLEDVAKLPKDVVLENVGIGISPTRMKCAMLGLRVAKSAAIGELAGWPDEE